MESRKSRIVAGVILALSLGACASGRSAPRTDLPAPPATPPNVTTPIEHPTLYATLWQQTAAEYRASAWQAYQAARDVLPTALADSTWTAAVEQEGEEYTALPPALVLDIDETVLDNSAQQARVILDGGTFDPESWGEWVNEAQAPAVPGAREFLAFAESLGVEVFYVTNRDVPLEPATRRNLKAASLPVDPALDTVLTRGEQDSWTSDKTSRREAIAERYRILLLVGDDFNDFVPARLPRPERDRLVERYRDRWGERWIILPNPTYGSWEGALYGEGELSAEDRARLRLDALEDLRP